MICLIVWQVFLISLLNVSKCEKHIYMYNDFFAMHFLCFRILLYVLRLESYYPILMFLYLYNTCFNTNSHTHLFLCCFYFVTIWAGSSRGELAESSKQAHGVSIQSRRKVTASSQCGHISSKKLKASSHQEFSNLYKAHREVME